jgi:radical SAM protein with 4Fe4S-binding SPASM domain
MRHPEPQLPADATLLPLTSGELLVSPEHAVFCRVATDDLPRLRQVLAGEAPASTLSATLTDDLETHGFFGDPRPEEDAPPTVQLQLTNACNLACSYCCTNSGDARPSEVSYERLCAVVDQIPEAIGTHARVALLGGEPLLVPFALDLSERILGLDLHLTIFTNGVPLGTDPALAKRVAELNERGAELRLSLAGPNRELCDEASGAPRFDATIRGCNALAEAGGEAIIDLMLLPQHVDAAVEHFPALRKRLPPGTKISLGLIFIGGRERGDHVFESPAAMEAALDRIAFEAGESISAPERSPLTERREACTCAMGKHIHVRSDGALFSCFKMEEKVGDLKSEVFGEVATHVQKNPHPARALSTCRDCPLVTICGGGCRSDNIFYTGSGDAALCDEWRVRVLCELLAEDRVTALEWPVAHLAAEARARGIDAPEQLVPGYPSRHVIDV